MPSGDQWRDVKMGGSVAFDGMAGVGAWLFGGAAVATKCGGPWSLLATRASSSWSMACGILAGASWRFLSGRASVNESCRYSQTFLRVKQGKRKSFK